MKPYIHTLPLKPQNLEEKVVWYYIIGTYLIYFMGAQYIVAPIAAWFLVFYLISKLWKQNESTPEEQKVKIPIGVWVWIGSMLILELALVIGHINFDLETLQIIKSTINFFRTWALFAVCPLIGCLDIRPKIIYRAVCILCLQSLIFIPVCVLATAIHLPNPLYISPLEKIGFGSGNEMLYAVTLSIYEPGNVGELRLSLFAPWCPLLGLLGNMYLFIAYLETKKFWRWIGIIGAIAMVLVSVSRAAIVCLLLVPLLGWLLVRISNPKSQIMLGVLSLIGSLGVSELIDWLNNFQNLLDKQRSDSSRVREVISRMTIDKWWKEAPVWGHGIIETSGPAVTAGMPLGTHSAWSSLLYSYGLIGAIAFAVPMIWSTFTLLIKSKVSTISKLSLKIIIVLSFFTFVESLGTQTYLFWYCLIFIGIALKEEQF
jgi:O-Antigen ligase